MNKQLFLTILLGVAVASLYTLPMVEEAPLPDEDAAVIAEIMGEEEASAAAEMEAEEAVAVTSPMVAALPVQEAAKPAALEKTFAMIKPDAVRNGVSGDIIKLIELNGFSVLKIEKKTLTQKEAEEFYAVHKGKGFFKDLINFMTSGPVLALVLEKTYAVRDWRYLMGKTNPEQAHFGTLRRMFATDITHNAVHGSDSPENAVIEINFFFPGTVKEVAKTADALQSEHPSALG